MNMRGALGLCLLAALAGPHVSTAAQGTRNHVVNIVSDYAGGRMYFEPKLLHINPGDTVTWVNLANEEHNVITFPDGYPADAEAFESPLLTSAGERWSHRFGTDGTYEYSCLPHLPMGMHAVVIVGRSSRHDEFHVPAAEEVAAYRHKMMEWFGDEATFKPREQRHESSDPAVN